jgi:trimethylguanosine synthase
MAADGRFESLCISHADVLERHGLALQQARQMLWHYWCRLSPEEMEFELDPEALGYLIVQQIGLQIAERIPGTSVVDALCGVGGMAIALARSGKRVTAIELNPVRLQMARHNAGLFGVEERITFIRGDAREVVPTLKADAVFLDPEWGGADYLSRQQTMLCDFVPDLGEMISLSLQVTPCVVCQVPANFVFQELERFERRFEHRAFHARDELLCQCVYFC